MREKNNDEKKHAINGQVDLRYSKVLNLNVMDFSTYLLIFSRNLMSMKSLDMAQTTLEWAVMENPAQ